MVNHKVSVNVWAMNFKNGSIMIDNDIVPDFDIFIIE